MDETDSVTLDVRVDTAGFARDVAAMRADLEGPLSAGADVAGRAIETSLLRAVRSGKLGFEDLKKAALSALAEIAAAQVRAAIGSAGGEGAGLAATLAGLVAGAPGRATGGPVAPGRAYTVGERGPELFVPTTSGRIEANTGGGARDVRVAITVNTTAGQESAALAQSSRQIARAVKAALASA